MEGVVCKHFQTGYCKFQQHCRKHHVKEICETEHCKTKACRYRHPKVCKLFTAHNTCKFGEQCAYHHKITKAGNEITEIVIKINALENTLTLLSEKIIFLEEELKSKDMYTHSSSTQTYQYDKSDYKASTKPVLKRHTTTKHKENISTPEKERCKDYDDSLKPMMTLDERAEALYSPPQPKEILTSMHLKCDICGHISESVAALQGHTSIRHDFNIPHTSKWDKKNVTSATSTSKRQYSSRIT